MQGSTFEEKSNQITTYCKRPFAIKKNESGFSHQSVRKSSSWSVIITKSFTIPPFEPRKMCLELRVVKGKVGECEKTSDGNETKNEFFVAIRSDCPLEVQS
jgi:hypothetical protein